MNAFRSIRERLGLSQAAIAAPLNVSQSNVSFYENGQTVPPAVAGKLIEFAATKGLPISYDHVYGAAELPPAPAETPAFVRSDGTVTRDERHPEHDPAFVKEKLAAEGPCALDPETPLAPPRHRRTDPPLAGYERGGVPQ